MGKYKIFVDGSSGTTGLRIADRLAERDEFEILKISEADRKDVRARAAVINESDLSFLCLPDDAAREVMPLVREDVRILDTSTAHRTAPGWVYGLPELHGTRAALPAAARVAVPGLPRHRVYRTRCAAGGAGAYPQGCAPFGHEPDRLQRRRQKDDRRVRGASDAQHGAERPAPLRSGAAPQASAGDDRCRTGWTPRPTLCRSWPTTTPVWRR